jgi:hypothetical protein
MNKMILVLSMIMTTVAIAAHAAQVAPAKVSLKAANVNYTLLATAVANDSTVQAAYQNSIKKLGAGTKCSSAEISLKDDQSFSGQVNFEFRVVCSTADYSSIQIRVQGEVLNAKGDFMLTSILFDNSGSNLKKRFLSN